MAMQTVRLVPGINVEKTPVLNEMGWSGSGNSRFRDGLPEKNGGFARLNTTALTGTGRGMCAWADLSGNDYAAVGTEQRLQLLSYGVLYDITPIAETTNPSPTFTTTATSTTVIVADAGYNPNVGDWVNVNVPVSVGGIIVWGLYQVQSVPTGTTYTITVASPATGTTVGGAVPSFASTYGQSALTVTLDNHGLQNNDIFIVEVLTIIAGITMAAGTSYPVSSVTTNTFVITPGPTANATTTILENSGNAQLQYLLPTGYASSIPLTGYGIGNYGNGKYGVSANASGPSTVRQWPLDHWGQDLIGNYTGGPIIVWTPPVSFGNVALAVNTSNYPSAADPPAQVNYSFVSTGTAQILIALGCSNLGGGSQDANLVRWCDVSDFTDWTPTAANLAGSFRIPSGSMLVGGIAMPMFNIIWTDVDMWAMSFIGGTLVYSFQKLVGGTGLVAPRASGIYLGAVYWASPEGFYIFDGSSPQPIPCTVWDYFWQNLDTTQQAKVTCAVNSSFGEVTWYFPSLAIPSGAPPGGPTQYTENNAYITYHARESQRASVPIWSYGALPRVCWADNTVFGGPLGVDTNGYIQQHEQGYDQDGQAMNAFIQSGWMAMAEGEEFISIGRFIPDLITENAESAISGANTVSITLYVQNYPGGPVTPYGPYSWAQGSGPQYFPARARGRFAALRIESTTPGVFWRLGGFKYDAQPSGRR